MLIEQDLSLENSNITHNPNHDFFKDFLKPYYVHTKDKQYLFASTQPGRRPDRAFYMVPPDYKLGKKQNPFDLKIGKELYKTAFDYLKTAKVIVQEGIQGESGYEAGLRITTSVQNPHSAYIAWMGKLMVFPPKQDMKVDCWNYIIPEPLPEQYISKIKEFWPEYAENEPITLYDFTELDKGIRRVISLGVDYFGGAFKKPNLTMVWNRAELNDLVSYHAGCTYDRILKGLSGTGKTTLTVGPELEQDDAVLGKPISKNEKIEKVQLIGLEAASFAKSQDLNPNSPEWPGLMKSKSGKAIVLAMNIDCEGIEYVEEEINGYRVKIPKGEPGSLECTKYDKSGTTNGRFIFLFSELNKNWSSGEEKFLKTESLSFKRYDVLEPMFRVTEPEMAVALDSACESIITSAVSGQKAGTRVRSYAATDFMVGEQSKQALLKWKMYEDLGLGLDDKLVFFINNAGFVGKYDLNGNELEQGEKIKVEDSKKLVDLLEHRKIKNWIEHPIYGYLIPSPKELEQEHGMENFGKRFNPLNYYTAEQIIEFAKRDIRERTEFLENLFKEQEGYDKLKPVIEVWEKCEIPSKEVIEEFYKENY